MQAVKATKEHRIGTGGTMGFIVGFFIGVIAGYIISALIMAGKDN